MKYLSRPTKAILLLGLFLCACLVAEIAWPQPDYTNTTLTRQQLEQKFPLSTNIVYFTEGDKCITTGVFEWMPAEFPRTSVYSNSLTGAIIEPEDFEFGNGHWCVLTNMGNSCWCILYVCAESKPKGYWLKANGTLNAVSQFGHSYNTGLVLTNSWATNRMVATVTITNISLDPADVAGWQSLIMVSNTATFPPAIFSGEIVTNWRTDYTQSPVLQSGEENDLVYRPVMKHQVGRIYSNTVATIEWHDKKIPVVLDSVFMFTIQRMIPSDQLSPFAQ